MNQKSFFNFFGKSKMYKSAYKNMKSNLKFFNFSFTQSNTFKMQTLLLNKFIVYNSLFIQNSSCQMQRFMNNMKGRMLITDPNSDSSLSDIKNEMTVMQLLKMLKEISIMKIGIFV